MRIFIVHNKYQQEGGEDVVVHNESELLKSEGHTIFLWIMDNKKLSGFSLLKKIFFGIQSIWSVWAYFEMKKRLKQFKPDIVHVHNTVPLLTPSIYWACKNSGIPVVQTLHNYRLICVLGTFYKDAICEKCQKGTKWNAVFFKCYRKSRWQSAMMAFMLWFNKSIGSYRCVDKYIVLSHFMDKKIRSLPGLKGKTVYKPNFLQKRPSIGEHKKHCALFVGRLSEEKGIKVLIHAWKEIGTQLPLEIIGDGELRPWVEAQDVDGVEALGWLPKEEVIRKMQNSKALIFPSLWYEGFPMTILEAFATGLPVIASNLGSQGEIIQEGITGWLFESGDKDDLIRAVNDMVGRLQKHPVSFFKASGVFDKEYSREANYERLVSIYNQSKYLN